jgi:hypothetical protein
MTNASRDESAPIIRFKLEGNRKEGDSVSLDDFLKFVDAGLTALRRIERDATGARTTAIDYLIVELEYGSATIAFAPVGTDPALQRHVATTFAITAAALRDDSLDLLNVDVGLRRAFEDLARPLKRGVRYASIEVDETRIELHGDEGRAFSLAPHSESAAVGSYSGNIDALNVHREHVFYLYPPVGPTRIQCVFDPLLLDDVRAALKRYTTVHGLLEYNEGNAFPVRIVVERIEVNPPEDQLPTLDDLWGIAPDLTGGMDSVAFVRQLRNAG